MDGPRLTRSMRGEGAEVDTERETTMTSVLASEADNVGAGHTGPIGFHEVMISAKGSTRGTAYIENNKIIMACGRLHVAWLVAGRGGKEGVRIRTLDLQRGQWSAAVTLGEADDNHGGPALTRDENGYLHVLFGPHSNPLSYCRSVRPDDASQWTTVEHFGVRCTYPSMVCDSGNTLHMVCRDSSTPGWTLMYYYRKEGGSWSDGRPLVEPTDKDGKYRCYRGTLFLDRKGVLHLGFMLFGGQAFKDAQAKGLAGYLRSEDAGRTWTHFDGTVVEDLPTDTGFERIPVRDNCIRTSNLVVDSNGIPCIVTVSTGFRGYQAKWGEAILWKRGTDGWQASPLNPFIEEVYPGHRASWDEPSLSVSDDGQLFVALTVVDSRLVDPEDARISGLHCGRPKSIFGNASSRIALLVSADGGRTFAARRVGRDVTGVPSWLPSLERFTGHNKIGIPHLLYTHCVTGEAAKGANLCRPKDVAGEIRLVSFDAALPDVEQPATNLNSWMPLTTELSE